MEMIKEKDVREGTWGKLLKIRNIRGLYVNLLRQKLLNI